MRVLVTGAGGFVGKGLCEHLSLRGHDVVAATRRVDSITAGRPLFISTVGPETDWSPALDGVEAVVHLAARAHVLHDPASNPLEEHRRVNTEGTRRLARQAGERGVRRFVFMSSIGVLGNNSLKSKNGHSFTEGDQPNPHDDYSRSKWEAEVALSEIPWMEKIVIRPPLIYGPDVPGNMRRLVGLAKKGRPFPLGGVHNKRSLIGRDNLCSFVSLALEGERASGQTFVISDNEQVSTAELYEIICRNLGVQSRLMSVPEPMLRTLLSALGKGKMAERLCDTLLVDATKAKEILGWKQVKSLENGLRETVLSYSEI